MDAPIQVREQLPWRQVIVIVAGIAQTFLQLVLLSIVMVGQRCSPSRQTCGPQRSSLTPRRHQRRA
jgi:hypothetical protein